MALVFVLLDSKMNTTRRHLLLTTEQTAPAWRQLMMGLCCMVAFLFSSAVRADGRLAVEHFLKGEAEFAANNLDAAEAWYKKSLELIAEDGPVIVGRETVERAVGSGRFATRQIQEDQHRADYFPNRRLAEIDAKRIEAMRRHAPPQLRIEWLALNEPTRDKVLDGGEKASLAFTVSNFGGSPALDVRLDVAVNDAHGLQFARQVDIGTIASNESVVANVPIEAARDVFTGNPQFTVLARERDGYATAPIAIAVATRPHEPARIAVSDVQLADLTGDGMIEATEMVTVTALVSNVGRGVSNQLIARLDLGKNVFTGPEYAEPMVLGALYPGQARTVRFTFLTNSDFDDDQKIPATLRVVDVSDNRVGEKDLDAHVHVPADKAVKQARVVAESDVGRDALDIAVKMPRSKKSNPDAVAVVIGNRNYTKAGLPSVKYAHNDARLMKDYFVTSMGVDEHNVLYIEDGTAASFYELFGNNETHMGRLFSYLKPGQSDVFVYYSGHGAPDISTSGAYFVPVDVDPNYLAVSGYSLDLFYRNLAKLPARSVTVVLDTCFSGNSDGGFLLTNISPASVRVKGEVPALANATIFTSAKPHQVSAWYHEKRHGLFTYYFLKGLSGAADADRDHAVTSTELGDYLSAEVSQQARRKYGREQNPMLIETRPLVMTEYEQ